MAYNLALNQLEKDVCPSLKLHNSASVLNNYQKSLGKELRSKTTLEKKEAKLKTKQNEDFKKKFIEDTKKVDPRFIRKSVADKEETNICSTKHLARIMLCFEEPEFANRPLTINDIKDFTLMNNNIINDGLKFLVKFNIIKETKNERGNYNYSK